MSADDIASGIVDIALSTGAVFPFGGNNTNSDAIWQQIVDFLAALSKKRPDRCSYMQVINSSKGFSYGINGSMDADFAYVVKHSDSTGRLESSDLFFTKFWYQPNTIIMYATERQPRDVMDLLTKYWHLSTSP